MPSAAKAFTHLKFKKSILLNTENGASIRTSRDEMKAQRKNTAILEVAQELDTVASMTVAQLMEKHREVFGEPTRSRNKAYLQKRISWLKDKIGYKLKV